MTSSQSSRLNVLMFAMGSAGDVHPFIGIGKALRIRGHSVCIVANSFFESIAHRANLDFVSSGSAWDYLQTTQNPELWQSKNSYRLMFEKILDAVPFIYRTIEEHNHRAPTLVIAPAVAFGARIAREKLAVPLIGMNVETNIFRSAFDLPGHNVPEFSKSFLPLFRRPIMDAIDRWFLDPQLSPRLNAFRSELGLAPVKRVMREWLHSPDCVIGLMPEWFSPRQPDWPSNLYFTGFPLFDDAEPTNLAPELTEFLDSGDPPIVFTLGTAMRFGQEFFRTASTICVRLRRRGIFLTNFPEQLPPVLPEGVRHFSYVPFSRLLSRTAALVHHGGIGSAAQALRAGIPQLIIPMIFDQPHNAAQLRRLGVGDSVPASLFTPEEGSRRLRRLITSAKVKTSCNELARRFIDDDSVPRTCSVIEDTATRLGCVTAFG